MESNTFGIHQEGQNQAADQQPGTSAEPIIHISSIDHPAAYFRLLFELSCAQRARETVIRWATTSPNEKIQAIGREKASLYLDQVTEIKLRLDLLRSRYKLQLQELEAYCAQPMVDLETIAAFVPKISTLEKQVQVITERIGA